MVYKGVDLLTLAKVQEDSQTDYKAEAPALIEVASIDIPEDGGTATVYKDGEAVNAYAIGSDAALKISTRAVSPDFLQMVLNGIQDTAFIDTGMTKTAFYALGFRLLLEDGTHTYWSWLKGTLSVDSKSVETEQGTAGEIEGLTFKPLVSLHEFDYNGKPCRKLVVYDKTHAVTEDGWLSKVWTPDDFIPVPAPTISVAEQFDRSVIATITPAEADLGITYTLDGTDPTMRSLPYSKPFKVERDSVIKAIAYSQSHHTSPIATLNVAELLTQNPILNVVTLYAKRRVSMVAEEGATIYYTLDGTPPTTNSATYSTPIDIEEPTMVKAFAKKDGSLSSDIVESEVLPPLELPIFAVEDNFDSAIITITEATKGATIHYSIDGGDFVDYTNPIEIERNCIIRANASVPFVGTSETAELEISTLKCRNVTIDKRVVLLIEKVTTPEIDIV